MYKRNASYNTTSQSILGKIGIGYIIDNITLGLTITTPKAQFKNTGDIKYERYLAGVDTSGDG